MVNHVFIVNGPCFRKLWANMYRVPRRIPCVRPMMNKVLRGGKRGRIESEREKAGEGRGELKTANAESLLGGWVMGGGKERWHAVTFAELGCAWGWLLARTLGPQSK